MRTDYDGPWKRALRSFLPEALQFFFPDAHAKIDWRRKFTLLDQELKRAAKDTQFPDLRVDQLVRVYLLDGGEIWILLHIEVQGMHDKKFTLRMFVYNYRLYDQHKKDVASFGILADSSATWRPSLYERNTLGTRLTMQFPVVKLKDFEARTAELEVSDNPFALVVLAHLKTKASHNDPLRRLEFKRHMLRLAYQSGRSKEFVRELLAVIDWLMVLPDNEERELQPVYKELEKMKEVEYVPFCARGEREKGRAEGDLLRARRSIVVLLRERFGRVPVTVKKVIDAMADVQALENAIGKVIRSSSLGDFERELEKSTTR